MCKVFAVIYSIVQLSEYIYIHADTILLKMIIIHQSGVQPYAIVFYKYARIW